MFSGHAGHVWIKSSINNKYNRNKWDQNTAGICITITFPIQGRGLWLTNYNENYHQTQYRQWMEHNSNCTKYHSSIAGISHWLQVLRIDIIGWWFYANYLVFANWFANKRLGDYSVLWKNICWNFLNVLLWNIEHCNKCCLASIFQILWKLLFKINGKSREK